jgi:beta-1,4-mannosyltransferase
MHADERHSPAPAAGSATQVRLAAMPATGGLNPAVDLFYRAVQPLGVQCVGGFVPTVVWLDEHHGEVDALHVHWPEPCWRQRLTERFGRLRRLKNFLEFVARVRRYGLTLVWTLHNIEPHEDVRAADRLGYRLLASAADLVICQSRAAEREFRQRYHPRRRTLVMHRGNYDGEYPEPAPRAEVLARFGLRPDLPTVAALGRIRAYKGLEMAVAAVRRLGGRVQLVIAGQPQTGHDLTALRTSAAAVSYVRVVERQQTRQEFGDVLAASDALILPYRQITNSGLFYAAMTFARGVVASDLPFFREMLAGHPDAGRLFPVNDAQALAQAIEAYLRVPEERRRRAARAFADEHAWDRVVAPAAAAIRECVARRRAVPRFARSGRRVLPDQTSDPAATRTEDPALSVLFATYNRAEVLRATFEAMTRLRTPKGGWELIVVDNRSTDDTAETCAAFSSRLPLRYLYEPRQGKNWALNRGLLAARGDLILFTDDDVTPCPDWLEAYEEANARWARYALFNGPIRTEWPSNAHKDLRTYRLPSTGFGAFALDMAEGPMPAGAYPNGANMAVRAAVFRAGVRYDPALGPKGRGRVSGGESDLLRRLFGAGHRCVYVPPAECLHRIKEHEVQFRALVKRAFDFGKGNAHWESQVSGPAATLWGMPRWQVRRALTEIRRLLPALLLPDLRATGLPPTRFLLSQALAYELGRLRQLLRERHACAS